MGLFIELPLKMSQSSPCHCRPVPLKHVTQEGIKLILGLAFIPPYIQGIWVMLDVPLNGLLGDFNERVREVTKKPPV